MNSDEICFSFGPVPSRRLGRSVGINHIPAKTCSYACVYCQIGRTTMMLAERRPFFSAAEIAADVRERAEQARGDLAASEYEGNEFYLRSFHKSAKAGPDQLSTASPSRPQGGRNAMEKDDANRILEGEIVDDKREGSPPLPVTKAPAPKAMGTGGWIEMIAAIGGGIMRWLASSSRNTPSGGGNKTGLGGGGGKMRRRRGGGR